MHIRLERWTEKSTASEKRSFQPKKTSFMFHFDWVWDSPQVLLFFLEEKWDTLQQFGACSSEPIRGIKVKKKTLKELPNNRFCYHFVQIAPRHLSLAHIVFAYLSYVCISQKLSHKVIDCRSLHLSVSRHEAQTPTAFTFYCSCMDHCKL